VGCRLDHVRAGRQRHLTTREKINEINAEIEKLQAQARSNIATRHELEELNKDTMNAIRKLKDERRHLTSSVFERPNPCP
jgi:uncharacterized coiled-coil DUF342 family protein